MQAIIDRIQEGRLPAEIAVVISDKPEAYGLIRAKQAGIPTLILPSSDYSDRITYDEILKGVVSCYSPDLIALSGFMRILSKEFVAHFEGRIINIHPSLLPKYPGLNTYEKVIAAGDKVHGSTVHYVTSELDAGPVILQRMLPILPDDTPVTLKIRTQILEHELYSDAIEKVLKELDA